MSVADYIKNIGWWIVPDIIAALLVAALVIVVCYKRKSVKLALMLIAYGVCCLTVLLINVLSGVGALFVTKGIMYAFAVFIAVTLAVVYQTDLKAFISKLVREDKKSNDYLNSADELKLAASEIVKACQTMSKNDIGALIIIAPTAVPAHIIDTGTPLNAVVSSNLLLSIFNTKAPLHDGAVVIKGNTILGAGCFLPLSQNINISKELGTRHRAAMGITEESDVFGIVVSEETGIISAVSGGKLTRYMTPEKLTEKIEDAFGINYYNKKSDIRK